MIPCADSIIGHCEFVDGARRAVYADGDRQYTCDNDRERVYGVFLLSEEERCLTAGEPSRAVVCDEQEGTLAPVARRGHNCLLAMHGGEHFSTRVRLLNRRPHDSISLRWLYEGGAWQGAPRGGAMPTRS